MDNRSPLLITGAHRSGTTWVGKMLAASGHYTYISEPLNVFHRRGVLDLPVEHWYQYISHQNEGIYLPAYDDLLHLRYRTWPEIKSLRSPKDVGRMFRDSWAFSRGRRQDQVPMLKDPFAVFSVQWFARRLGCRVLITVRHPAAFYSSLKRLDWSFSFKHLLEQPLLMDDWLEPFQADITSTQAAGSALERACLLWRLVYHTVHRYQQTTQPYIIVRHEDLSLNPVERFAEIYKRLGLGFDEEIQARILSATGGDNPSEVSKKDIYSVNLDSRANLENWKKRLTPEEINQVRILTEDVAPYFYSDEDWA